jgi:hypothetical protein
VAVEKVGFSEKSRKSGDRKCLGDWGVLTRPDFCGFPEREFFNISNEVGRVKRDLIFFLVRACIPQFTPDPNDPTRFVPSCTVTGPSGKMLEKDCYPQ